jgi:hypothetical protein
VIAAAEGEAAPTPPEEPVGAPESPPDAGQPAQPEAEPGEPGAQSEEQSTDVDALQGQVPETTEGPQTG